MIINSIKDNKITYEPDMYFKCGAKIWLYMFKDLVKSRELIWRFFIEGS